MSKSNKSTGQEIVEALKEATEATQVAPPVFTRFMVGTYIDPLTGEWMLAYAKFNPLTKQMDVLQTERVAGDREVMRERLTIKQAQLGLYDAAPVVGNGKLEEIY